MQAAAPAGAPSIRPAVKTAKLASVSGTGLKGKSTLRRAQTAMNRLAPTTRVTCWARELGSARATVKVFMKVSVSRNGFFGLFQGFAHHRIRRVAQVLPDTDICGQSRAQKRKRSENEDGVKKRHQ